MKASELLGFVRSTIDRKGDGLAFSGYGDDYGVMIVQGGSDDVRWTNQQGESIPVHDEAGEMMFASEFVVSIGDFIARHGDCEIRMGGWESHS